MGSTVIDIPDGEGVVPGSKEKKKKVGDICCQFPIDLFFKEMKSNKHMTRKVIHSIKVGVALVFVSLLYLLDPLYKQVGENAMWAIMTVVVVFEFFAGATLSKGINRGIGTVLGGGLGCLAAIFAQAVGGVGKAIIVGITVFIFGAAATYTRQVPNVKKKFDYGAMIFILTFSLVVVSGLRAEQVLEIARDRLSTIAMGFAICLFISLLVFPIWASDELHDSLVARFEDLAVSLEGFLIISFNSTSHSKLTLMLKSLVLHMLLSISTLAQGFSKEYFENVNEKEKSSFNFSSKCKSVLHSKTKDESLVNFASWEPWHAKFGFCYPWGIYLKLGEDLRDLATTILSLKGCLKSPTQPSESNTCRQPVKEPCEAIVASLAWTLRELGESIKKMKKCGSEDTILPKLKTVRQELSQIPGPSTLGTNNLERTDGLGLATFMYSMVEMVEKMEELAKHVEQLGQRGGFS
ncbi:hypothetical protein Godav_027063 [Gossypium davidsonii]|uniref:Aluminum-activated malate transporter n=3 Tax=Gossypium TaxID=3633 RepID=A0A7J8RWC9_GOSDV|nr:hypothetical protein [Gossypium davidsonii]